MEAIRKVLPVKVKHQFDFKTKGGIIAGMILLIVTGISTGLCGHLWAENNHLHAVDIKYRLLQQVSMHDTNWADSVYNNNPNGAEEAVVSTENSSKPTQPKVNNKLKTTIYKRWHRRIKS